MPDDIAVLRDLLGSVYLTGTQKLALSRLIDRVARSPRRVAFTPTTAGATAALPTDGVEPILGPGDAQ